MTLSKTSVQPIDLDDLERQLREVAVSSLPKKKDDPLAELARIVGRDKPLRAVPGGRAQAPEAAPSRAAAAREGGMSELRPGAPHADQSQFDLEASIKDALRADHVQNYAQGNVDEAQDLAQDLTYEQDAAAPEDATAQYSEEWEEPPYQEDAGDLDEQGAPRFDGVEQVPGMPQGGSEPGAPARRSFLSPRALALAVPLVLVAVGVGAAVVMRGGPMRHIGGEAPVITADAAPVKVQPDKAASGDQTPSQAALGAADASGKPSQVSLVRAEQPVDVVAAAKSAQPRDSALGQPPASSGIVILSGPGASSQASTGGALAAAPASAAPAAPNAGAPAMSTSAANVPLPAPPALAGQSSVFGTPRRVSTVSVKPDGTIVSNGKPKTDAKPDIKADTTPSKPVVVASADTTTAPAATGSVTPAARKLADTTRTKPKPKAENTQADQHEASGAPMSITPQGPRGHTVVASAAPVQNIQPPAAAASGTSSNATSGSGFSIQLASSPSESDARATLSRLQRQFPSALGGGAVHRADLGSKGVFYRVRVGPLSRDAADKICTQLKAGGAECILTRG
ncbi:Sporulation related domain-containing protein [Rhizobiales bacterium GAS188]|nr:Sporulation related domain-containing protein [Rhizobiales bacterium GAS188]